MITANAYGSSKSFTVVSDKEAAADNSGIGTSVLDAVGLDVAGTINGEPATGNGQVLTGDDSPANVYTNGLALLITATSPGTYGTVTFTRGIASAVSDAVASFVDPQTGALSEHDRQLQAQIDAMDQEITRMQERMERRGQELRARFSQLETLIARMQAQQARLNSLFKAWNTS